MLLLERLLMLSLAFLRPYAGREHDLSLEVFVQLA